MALSAGDVLAWDLCGVALLGQALRWKAEGLAHRFGPRRPFCSGQGGDLSLPPNLEQALGLASAFLISQVCARPGPGSQGPQRASVWVSELSPGPVYTCLLAHCGPTPPPACTALLTWSGHPDWCWPPRVLSWISPDGRFPSKHVLRAALPTGETQLPQHCDTVGHPWVGSSEEAGQWCVCTEGAPAGWVPMEV